MFFFIKKTNQLDVFRWGRIRSDTNHTPPYTFEFLYWSGQGICKNNDRVLFKNINILNPKNKKLRIFTGPSKLILKKKLFNSLFRFFYVLGFFKVNITLIFNDLLEVLQRPFWGSPTCIFFKNF